MPIKKFNDIILSGILYIEQLETEYEILIKDLKKRNLWSEFKSVVSPFNMPLSLNKFIINYINDTQKEIPSFTDEISFKEVAILIDSIKRVWKMPQYQNKSNRINESSYTHDLLIHIMNFLSFGFEKEFWIRW